MAVAPAPDEDGNVTAAAPDAVINVESLPLDDEEDDFGAPGSRDNGNGFTYSINKQAGMINVYASQKSHEEVDAYLKVLRKLSTAQVLIEAKILEVSLNDEFATGIDWTAVDLLSGEAVFQYLTDGFSFDTNSAPSPIGSSIVANANNLVVGYNGNDVQAIVQAISGFGTVRALASPRLTVLNNQSAVLNVATNRVFFELDVDVTDDADTDERTVDVDSEIRNVPEGVLVNVQPSINLDENTVSLAVRPTITRVINERADPAVQYLAAVSEVTSLQSLIPELNVQEIDSVIRVRSGQPIVMGGLLQDRIQRISRFRTYTRRNPSCRSLIQRSSRFNSKDRACNLAKGNNTCRPVTNSP